MMDENEREYPWVWIKPVGTPAEVVRIVEYAKDLVDAGHKWIALGPDGENLDTVRLN